jgi:hypothetical protein
VSIIPSLKFWLAIYYKIWANEATTCGGRKHFLSPKSVAGAFKWLYRRKQQLLFYLLWNLLVKEAHNNQDFRKLPLNATAFETLNGLKSWGAVLSGYRDVL